MGSQNRNSMTRIRSLMRSAPRSSVSRCDLCSVEIPASRHRHLLELAVHQVRCVCDPCALRFQDVVGGKFRLIPRDAQALPDFQITDAQWDNLAIPINLAFFYYSSLG